ncbi:hypothetical protein M758_UG030300 [Ceratodon purpureus]|nr:hypothetical protein M758_UG030300 [Ceratodon purpureus]
MASLSSFLDNDFAEPSVTSVILRGTLRILFLSFCLGAWGAVSFFTPAAVPFARFHSSISSLVTLKSAPFKSPTVPFAVRLASMEVRLARGSTTSIHSDTSMTCSARSRLTTPVLSSRK